LQTSPVPQLVPPGVCWQTPPDAQAPVNPHVAGVHCPAGAAVPAVMLEQTPSAPPVRALEQAWQVPLHAELQQKLFTQKPRAHWVPRVQGVPLAPPSAAASAAASEPPSVPLLEPESAPLLDPDSFVASMPLLDPDSIVASMPPLDPEPLPDPDAASVVASPPPLDPVSPPPSCASSGISTALGTQPQCRPPKARAHTHETARNVSRT
jgi:hypothetical protein